MFAGTNILTLFLHLFLPHKILSMDIFADNSFNKRPTPAEKRRILNLMLALHIKFALKIIHRENGKTLFTASMLNFPITQHNFLFPFQRNFFFALRKAKHIQWNFPAWLEHICAHTAA
jgi:hypothetical protein